MSATATGPPAPTIKVSVIVPTYCTGDGLDRLVASLDAQTLPAAEFEIVFVDDGSPDNTFARLQEVARTRPNVIALRIENSGWPCRPRNIGTDHARGEYVAYMDHDDELYPDGLRAAYEYAHANGADVLTAKESRTHRATWAIDTYRTDLPQSIGREDHHPLVPMNPHKLYRRAFLQQHGIRFIEEGRVMFEDIFFNVAVERHAQVISTLSSVPYYHWVQTKGSGSTAFRRENPEYWKWMRRVIAATDTELAEQPLAHRQLMGHHYRSRIIASFDAKFSKRTDVERDDIFARCRSVQHDFDLSRFDDALNASGRLRAHLLRENRQDLLTALSTADKGVPGWGRVSHMRWTGGILHLDIEAEWSSADGRTLALERRGDRIVKTLPVEIADAVPAKLRDVTDEIARATVEIGMRNRSDRVVWMLPSAGSVSVHDAADGPVRLTGTASAQLDPATAASGAPLGAARWDLNVRVELGGTATQQPLRAGSGSTTAALRDGRLLLAYVNDSDQVTVLAEDAIGELLRRSMPTGAVRADDASVLIRLAGEHDGSGSLPVQVPTRDGVGIDGELLFDAGTATLRLPALKEHRAFVLGDRAGDRPACWTLDATGPEVMLTPVARAVLATPKPSFIAWLRNGIAWRLRKYGLRR